MLLLNVAEANVSPVLFDAMGVLMCTGMLASMLAIHGAASRYLFALGRERGAFRQMAAEDLLAQPRGQEIGGLGHLDQADDSRLQSCRLWRVVHLGFPRWAGFCEPHPVHS